MDTMLRWLKSLPGLSLWLLLLSACSEPARAAAGTDPPLPPPAPAGQSGVALLPALVDATALPATLVDGRLDGPGAQFLRSQIAGARFVLLGEDHGSAGVADFASALWRDLARDGFGHVAIETDPWMARYAEREVRRGGAAGLGAALQAGPGAIALPFYGWDAEAAFLETVLATAPVRHSATLWGLDQVFIGSGTLLLQDIARGARAPAARQLAAELVPLARDRNFLVGPQRPQLAALAAELGRGESALRERITAMQQSGEIYRAFTTGDREAWPANLEREALMKRNLLQQLAAAQRADGALPRVLFKFGANHLTRGLSPTLVPSLGSFAMAWADARGERSVNIAVLCGPAARSATFSGEDVPCGPDFSSYLGDAAPLLARGPLTVIDLRVWRQRPSRWATLPDMGRRIIEGYDVLVVVDGTRASRYLPGLTPPAP